MLRKKKAPSTFGCLPVLTFLEKVTQKCPLKNKSVISLGGTRGSVLLLRQQIKFSNCKKMCDRSVLLITEVSLGRTEGSFGFCEKTEVSFFTMFWDRSVFSSIFFTKKSHTDIFSNSTSDKTTQKTTTSNVKSDSRN